MTPQSIGWEQNSETLLKMFGISDPKHHLKKIVLSVDFVIGAKPGIPEEKTAK
ncbi:Uncharacterised protein [uncultured archaeon]|nr:Uncharacterised protein [uncultured archaeon]